MDSTYYPVCILTKCTRTEKFKKLTESSKSTFIDISLCTHWWKYIVPSKYKKYCVIKIPWFFPDFWKNYKIPWLFPDWKNNFQFSLISRSCRYPGKGGGSKDQSCSDCLKHIHGCHIWVGSKFPGISLFFPNILFFEIKIKDYPQNN